MPKFGENIFATFKTVKLTKRKLTTKFYVYREYTFSKLKVLSYIFLCFKLKVNV
jgi:hypothetical protein